MKALANNDSNVKLMTTTRDESGLSVARTLPIIGWQLNDDLSGQAIPISIMPLVPKMPYVIWYSITLMWHDPINEENGYGEKSLAEYFAEVIQDVDSEILERVLDYVRQHPDKVVVESGYGIFRKPMLAVAFGDHVFSTGIAALLAQKRVKFEANKYWVDLDG